MHIEGLRLDVKVGGHEVPVRIQNVDGGFGWRADGRAWSGNVAAGGRIGVWWAVDREQVTATTALLLAEGARYEATVDFAWRHNSCAFRAAGHLTETFSDYVEASANARTFQAHGTPQFEATATGAGFRADFRTSSGLEARITTAEAKAVVLTTGAAGGLALVTFPTVGWTVNGQAGDVVKPADTLRVHSAASALAHGTYGTSGTIVGDLPSGGLVVLLVDINYQPKDPTPGTPRDSFAFGIAR